MVAAVLLFFFTGPCAHRVVMASPYDRELDIVTIRAREHATADRIVLCESDRTQSGHPRSFRLPVIKSLHSEIETYNTSCYAPDRDHKLAWKCENAPRQCAVSHACQNEPDSTVVVVSDTDEIISGEVIASLQKTGVAPGFQVMFSKTMSVHVYGFFWEIPGFAYSTAHAKTCGTIRSALRPRHIHYPRFAGWHCSYCFPVDEYLSKIHSMLKGDGWLSLSDHYWSLETLYAFRQHGIPLNGKDPMQPAHTPPPAAASLVPYLLKNTNLKLDKPEHPFTWPRTIKR